VLRTIGALLVVMGAAGTGVGLSVFVRHSAGILQQLIMSLEQMKSEILFRKTPLPELTARLAENCGGEVGSFWSEVSDGLRIGQARSVCEVMRRALSGRAAGSFPAQARRTLQNLGAGLGNYDAAGQVRAVDLALSRLGGLFTELRDEQKSRMKSYCTLGVCAGLALAILML